MSMTNALELDLGMNADGEINTESFNDTSVYSRNVVPELTAEQKAMILET